MPQEDLPNLVIPAGEKKSNPLALGVLERLRSPGVYAPQDLTGNVIFEAVPVSAEDATESDYREVVVQGDVPQIKAGQVVSLDVVPFVALRVSLSETSNAEQVFETTGWQHRTSL